MAITSTESFLALLEKSQLLGAKDLEKVRAAAGKYDDAKALARALVAAKGLTRWQAGQLLAGRSSFTLGKFRLIDLLGRGGMGSVFAAEHKTMGRRVALKIISKQTGRDPEQLERFLAEARRIAALDHPNIVRAFDVDHEGERYFLVMEYVQGRDLQQMVENDGPLDVRRAVRFIRQAALGLAHAHDRNMIHCDIKPANLIVGDDDVVKILDMGMSRLVESDGSSSDSNENIVGTIDYIAPEQALEAEDLDHRVDIYSLGCTLYFLLTSRPPFGEGTLAQRILKHQTQEPRPLAELRSGVPDELARICCRMMAKKPGERFQTAAEVAKALEPLAGVVVSPVAVQDTPLVANDPAVVELIDDDPAETAAGEVSITVADSGSFSARGGASRTRRPAAPKKIEAKKAEAAAAQGFFADPRKKWAAMIVVSLLVLGAAGGGLAWMMSGGSQAPDKVAEGNTASAQSPPDATAPAAEPEPEPELDNDLADLEGTFGQTDSSPEEMPAAETPQSAPDSDAQPAPAETTDQTAMTAPPNPSERGEPGEQASAGDGSESEAPQTTEEPPEAMQEEKPGDVEAQPEEKPPAEPETPKVEPFQDFPKAFDIPVFSDSDAAGQDSKAPLALGTIHGPPDMNWQLLLLGGDKVLKGGREFVLALTESDPSKAAWSIHLSGSSSAAGQENVARLWREGQALNFQWADEAPGATANYLRNCMLQARVAGNSRFAALAPPVQAEPIALDLIRGQSNGSVALKWAPDEELLRFKLDKIEGFGKAVFEPDGPVAPKTQVALNFVFTDQHENDINAVVFRIQPTARKTSVNLDVRLMQPQVGLFKPLSGYNDPQLGVMIDRMGTQRTELQKKLNNLKGEEAHKATREVDKISGDMWYLEFFLKAHRKAMLHYQVVADLGGQEVVLVTTR